MSRPFLVIMGTRPEVVKLAPVVHALKARGEDVVVCDTGQHPDMVKPFFEFFEVSPTFNLELMKPHQPLAELAGRALISISRLIRQVNPRAVVVQGDTTSALAGALAAFHESVPLIHVEAGLRTFDLAAPFPEEGHRVLISRLARVRFAPTETALANLHSEGIRDNAFCVGNTVVDAMQWAGLKLPPLEEQLSRLLPVSDRRLILMTVHRRENLGAALESICRAVRALVAAHDDVEVALPVHPNPGVQEAVRRVLGAVPRIHLLPPLPYPQLLWLLKRSYLVLTDSGGLQEEAPSFGKPVLVLREQTERTEGIVAGCARLAGTSEASVLECTGALLCDAEAYRRMSTVRNPYGDGHAATAIAHCLEKFS